MESAHPLRNRAHHGFFFAGVRIAGSTLLVPLLEEVFYRSFLYRYIAAPNWICTPHNRFNAKRGSWSLQSSLG
ncbi:MAG: hypothetical protein CM1200mP29_14030 [Verrucomicrobiota bacterium]|nr:MAG: hypothetical protein CM1200mP29_14030 [Verrucomicrobiota bacterium]